MAFKPFKIKKQRFEPLSKWIKAERLKLKKNERKRRQKSNKKL